MNTSAIVAIIMGVLMMVLSFVLYPTINNAMDDLYLYFTDSCKLKNERFVKAYIGVTTASNTETDNTFVYAGEDKGNYYGAGIPISTNCEIAGSVSEAPASFIEGFPALSPEFFRQEATDNTTGANRLAKRNTARESAFDSAVSLGKNIYTDFVNKRGWEVSYVDPVFVGQTSGANSGRDRVFAGDITLSADIILYNEREQEIVKHQISYTFEDVFKIFTTATDGTNSVPTASASATLRVTETAYGSIPSGTFGTLTTPTDISLDVSSIKDAEWVAVPSILEQFGGIGRLVLSVMPIMILASFLGLVAMGLIDYGRGMSQGGIAGAVGSAIIQLIVVIVLLEVLPTVIDAMVDSNQHATGGRFSVNSQFQGIMGIIFAALPLLLVVGILGISGFMLFQKGRNFRAGGA